MTTVATHYYDKTGRRTTVYKEVPDQPNPFVTTPAQHQQIAHAGGGILSEIGRTTDIKPTKEAIQRHEEKQVSEAVGEPVKETGGMSIAEAGESRVFVGESGKQYFYSQEQEKIFFEGQQKVEQPTPQEQFILSAEGIQYNPFKKEYIQFQTRPLTPTELGEQIGQRIIAEQVYTAQAVSSYAGWLATANVVTAITLGIGQGVSSLPFTFHGLPVGKVAIGTAIGTYYTHEASKEYFQGTLTPQKALLYSVPIIAGYGSVLLAGYQAEFKQWDKAFETHVQKGITEDKIKYGLSLIDRTVYRTKGEYLPRYYGYKFTSDVSTGTMALDYVKGSPASIPRQDIQSLWVSTKVTANYPALSTPQLIYGKDLTTPTTKIYTRPATDKLFVYSRAGHSGEARGFVVTDLGVKGKEGLINYNYFLSNNIKRTIGTDIVFDKLTIDSKVTDFSNFYGTMKTFKLNFRAVDTTDEIIGAFKYGEQVLTSDIPQSARQRLWVFDIESQIEKPVGTWAKPVSNLKDIKISNLLSDVKTKLTDTSYDIPRDTGKLNLLTKADTRTYPIGTETLVNIPKGEIFKEVVITPIRRTTKTDIWSSVQTPLQLAFSGAGFRTDQKQREGSRVRENLELTSVSIHQKRFDELKNIQSPIQRDFTSTRRDVSQNIGVGSIQSMALGQQQLQRQGLKQLQMQTQITRFKQIPYRDPRPPEPSDPIKPEGFHFNIPTSKSSLSKRFGFKRLRFKRPKFRKSRKSILPTADLFSIQTSVGKYGKATFVRSKAGVREFRRRMRRSGVFMRFPTAELIKKSKRRRKM